LFRKIGKKFEPLSFEMEKIGKMASFGAERKEFNLDFQFSSFVFTSNWIEGRTGCCGVNGETGDWTSGWEEERTGEIGTNGEGAFLGVSSNPWEEDEREGVSEEKSKAKVI